MTEQEQAQDEAQEKAKAFQEKHENFKKDMNALAEKYNFGCVGAFYFRSEDLSGTQAFGKLNHVEEAGLINNVVKINNK